MTWQNFFKSKFSTYILSAVLLVVMVLAAKILIQKYRVESEISQLQSEIEKVRKNNDQLTSLIKYFGTSEYQEKAAREKLSLKKEGEIVVGLPQQEETNINDQNQLAKVSNVKKWYNYFFNK